MNKISVYHENVSCPAERKLEYVHIYITRKCNLHCLHCYTDSDVKIEEIKSGEFWKDVIWQLDHLGVKCLHIEGGEALYYPQIEDIISEVKKTKIKELLIVTNGILATPEKLAKLKAAGLKKIAVSLDSFEEEKHNLLRPKSQKYAIKALEEAVHQGFYTRVSTVLTKKNVGDIISFVDTLYHMGIRTINIDWFNSAGRGLMLYEEFAIKEDDTRFLNEFEKAVKIIAENKEYENFNISIDLPEWYERRNSYLSTDPKRTHYLSCDAISKQISINEIGNVYPCFIYSNGEEYIGNLGEKRLEEILEDKIHKVKCPISAKKHLFYQIQF